MLVLFRSPKLYGTWLTICVGETCSRGDAIPSMYTCVPNKVVGSGVVPESGASAEARSERFDPLISTSIPGAAVAAVPAERYAPEAVATMLAGLEVLAASVI